MNKLQMIELLKLRGITELNGTTIGAALKESGGNGSLKEMAQVN